jgi:hypothetical protein
MRNRTAETPPSLVGESQIDPEAGYDCGKVFWRQLFGVRFCGVAATARSLISQKGSDEDESIHRKNNTAV